MHLAAPLIRLPLQADTARLAEEVLAIDEAAWVPHPQGFPGNHALPLVSRGGDPADDAAEGIMRPTPHLARLPYVQRIMGALGSVIGRSRLMRLDAESDATPHVDVHHYWLERVRVHVPVVTHPEVEFIVGEERAHMAPGECWVFDTWSRHAVRNPVDAPRIHLVIDTTGSERLWQMIEHPHGPAVSVSPDGPGDPLTFETVNRAAVMSPWEMERLIDRILVGSPATTRSRS